MKVDRSIVFSLGRGLLVFLVSWGVIELLGSVLQFSVTWPVWVVAGLVAASVELVVFLYRYEQGAVGKRKGRGLTVLRLAALMAVVWMLLQPVFSRKVNRSLEREVVVLMDDSASMHLTDDGESATRFELGTAALKESDFFEQLEGKVGVRTLWAARRVVSEGEEPADGWEQATDLKGALATVLEQVPPDNLAGVVLVTDGRHNRPGRVEDVARRFGILDAPVGIVAVGSEKPPRDAAILEVRSPDAIYLGDRMRVTTTVKFDGYRGQRAKLKLMRGTVVVEEEVISIPQDRHREEVRFQDVPRAGGVTAYRVELEELPGERFANNNSWAFETAITDARTNVLIVDSHPRWEFRYLRNLFYGRDKSIHLQYVLLNPDTILGQRERTIPASASRKFGDAQATALPENEADWRKFDVIILGDVPPDAFSEETWKIVERCVTDRAAMLVAIAGPRYMPHAHTSETARELFPVRYAPGRRTYFGSREEPYRLVLTAEGRNHPVTAQSDSRLENQRIWGQFPEFRWRHPIEGVKEGAEVLAAASWGGDEPKRIGSAAELGDALSRLAERKAEETRNAILVAQQVGNGKVAMLLTDRTWRLREGVGDVYHHRLWGQLVRWGAGPNLRSGTTTVRLGTDQLTYTGDDELQITARLWNENKTPVEDPTLKAEIWKDGEKLTTVQLVYREGSPGLHDGTAGPFAHAGNYEIVLTGEAAAGLLQKEGQSRVTTGFRVVSARSPVELSETTLNRPLLETVAALSGGRVVAPEDSGGLAGLFLTGDETREELRETRLWDHWLLILIFCGLLTAEWVVRRGSGLP